MFFPKTDPNEPGFLGEKWNDASMRLPPAQTCRKCYTRGFRTRSRVEHPDWRAPVYFPTDIGCWSDEEAWYVPDIESVRMLLDAGAVPSGNPKRPVTEEGYYTLLMHAAWAGMSRSANCSWSAAPRSTRFISAKPQRLA